MSTSYFVKAMKALGDIEYMEVDRVDNTSKIRTYAADAGLYSSESDLEKLEARLQSQRLLNQSQAKDSQGLDRGISRIRRCP